MPKTTVALSQSNADASIHAKGSSASSLLLTPSQRAHLLLYSHAESPCGNRIVYGTNFGHLLVFDLTLGGHGKSVELGHEEVEGVSEPDCVAIAASDSGVYSLATVANGDGGGGGFLAAGSAGRIAGYRWSLSAGLHCAGSSSASWNLELPDNTEANSMAVLGGGGSQKLLAVGCGDGCVRMFDLGHGGKLAKCWTAAEARCPSVLRVAAAAADTDRALLAAADDSGCVRLLDPRQRVPRCELRPARAAPEAVARPALGDWLGCLACRPDSPDWLACGGGPRLAVWHAANLREPVSIATIAPQPQLPTSSQFAPMSAAFVSAGGGATPDRILLAGGNAPVALQFSAATGALVSSAGVACDQVLSVGCLSSSSSSGREATGSSVGGAWRLTACGLGPRADVCSSLGYRLFSFAA